MQTVLQDLKQAVRGLAKHPGPLVTAVLTLAVGIGFSTATFSVTNAVLLRPLPYDEPSRLVNLSERVPPRTIQFAVSPAHFLFWRDHATAFEGIGAWQAVQVSVQSGGEEPQRVHADRVTANLFAILRVAPALGRAFLPSDDESGAQRVVLLSHGTWQRRFGAAGDILGATIRVNQQPATVVGVMPPGFAFPSAETELWVPAAFSAAERRGYSSHFLSSIGRLAPGVTLARAQADLKEVSARLGEVNPGSAGWEVQLTDLRDDTVQDVRRPLLVLAGAGALVLLIACVNVANLLLLGGAARQRELAIRTAIGATRGRLLRQLVVEQVALAAISASAGVLIAAWLVRALLRLVPDALPRQETIGIDGEVLAFAIALAALTPLLFGLIPALLASRPDVRVLLAASGRQGAAPPARRLRTVLVTAEMALAMVLLVGAGLLVRSFVNLLGEPPGLVPARAIVTSLSLPVDAYPPGEPRQRFLHEFLARARALPEVAAIGLAMPMPMIDAFSGGFEIEGQPQPRDQRPIVNFFAVGAGYFAAAGTPLLKGRVLEDTDRAGGTRVVVINQTMADRFFAGVDPIGRRLLVTQGDNAWREIVGVVGDVKSIGLAEHASPQVYESYLQHPYLNDFSIVARTTSDRPTAIVPALRTVLRSMDARLPLGEVRTLEDIVSATVRPQRFSTTLIGVFGVAALLLAAVGVYSVMASAVGLRRQEFAIRVAHGARRADILTLVLRGAVGMSLAGIAAGGIMAWLLRRLMEGLLFGVSAEDRATYLTVTTLLALVALVASAVPALRAATSDPIAALRGE
jgi:putative ABC transport system permease protein